MTIRAWRRLGFGLAIALAGCEPAPAPDEAAPANRAVPAPAAPAAAPAVNASNAHSVAEAAASEKAVEVPEDAPGLAEMSPFRRRAYEAGYRDCLAGRYDPDPWPEAYRIGCGAAQEAQ